MVHAETKKKRLLAQRRKEVVPRGDAALRSWEERRPSAGREPFAPLRLCAKIKIPEFPEIAAVRAAASPRENLLLRINLRTPTRPRRSRASRVSPPSPA